MWESAGITTPDSKAGYGGEWEVRKKMLNRRERRDGEPI